MCDSFDRRDPAIDKNAIGVVTIFCQTSQAFCEDCRRRLRIVRRLFECGKREGYGFLVAHCGTAGREGFALVA